MRVGVIYGHTPPMMCLPTLPLLVENLDLI